MRYPTPSSTLDLILETVTAIALSCILFLLLIGAML